MVSKTNFGHFPSHASPKKIDFVASEAIRKHVPSLIESCMVRKYSFRGFRNSFWTFPLADPEVHVRHCLGPGSKMWFAKGSSLCSCILKSPWCGNEWTQIRYGMFLYALFHNFTVHLMHGLTLVYIYIYYIILYYIILYYIILYYIILYYIILYYIEYYIYIYIYIYRAPPA